MSNRVKDEVAEELIVKSRVKMLMMLPFYGTLLCNLEPEEKPEVGTMATDGNKIYYNPDFVKGLTLTELAFVNAHEVMHVALGSIWRRGDRVHEVWNWATDYAINGILHDTCCDNTLAEYFKMPDAVLYDAKYNGMCAEEIYDILIKEFNNSLSNQLNNNGNGGDQEDTSGMNGGGKINKNGNKPVILDNHSMWDSKEAQEDKEQKMAEWNGKLADSAMRHAGSTPAGAQRYISKILEPKKDWRQELAEHIQEEVNDYSFNPPDRRYGELTLFGNEFFLPDFNEMEDVAKDIVFWIDTSGSISNEDLTVFYSEIVGAVNQFGGKLTGYIGFFDYVAYDPIPFDDVTDILKIVPKGGGGTSFEAFMNRTVELENEGKLNISSVVVFTDGYCDYPDKNPIKQPLLWVMTTDEEAPYGRTTHMHV